jgi:hypothetical protein
MDVRIVYYTRILELSSQKRFLPLITVLLPVALANATYLMSNLPFSMRGYATLSVVLLS